MNVVPRAKRVYEGPGVVDIECYLGRDSDAMLHIVPTGEKPRWKSGQGVFWTMGAGVNGTWIVYEGETMWMKLRPNSEEYDGFSAHARIIESKADPHL